MGQSRYPNGNPSVSIAPTTRARTNSASIGVVLNWPLFAGYAIENRVAETLALQDKARADLDNLQRTVSQSARSPVALFSANAAIRTTCWMCSRVVKRPSTRVRSKW